MLLWLLVFLPFARRCCLLIAAAADAVAAVASRVVAVISVVVADGIETLLVLSWPCLLQWQRAPLLLLVLLPLFVFD